MMAKAKQKRATTKRKPKRKQTGGQKPENAAPKQKTDRKPRNWDKVTAAAYLRLLGGSQEISAKGAGCSRRSVQMWEKKSWWKDALDEARDRWLQDGDAAAMRTHLAIFNDPAERGVHTRWAMERRFAEFKPPPTRVGFGDGDGDGEPVDLTVRFIKS